MRAGVCAAQQTLSVEAASVLKHSLSLARRRGHAQVTPLHVAATLLSSRASPLRRACLKSQPNQPSHPLQCRALELCFNVALNRLPATPAPLLHAQPSLSNAIVAALKRAQAHQRRGCIEQQQQSPPPLIGVKVELEQLILSILDDPSVSRVMREAGFSSTAVKNNMEESTNSVSSVFQCYNNSGGIYSTPSSPPNYDQNPNSFWHSNLMSYVSENNPLIFSPDQKGILSKPDANTSSLKEDIKLVFEVLLRKKRRNTVIVGDSFSMNEALVAELMNKVKRGDVPEELKSVYFVKFQFSSVPLQLMKREEVDMHIDDLKRKVESSASNGRVIIYTGDLKWTVEELFCGGKEATVYSPIDHLVSGIAKLLSWYNNDSLNTRVWLMATASYQTYTKCQMKQPPLDVQWSLQAVSVPSGGLGLSLNATATIGLDSRIAFNENPSNVMHKCPFFGKEEDQDILNCCPECTSNFEKEASQNDSFSLNKKTEKASVQLPYWLKPQGIETYEKEGLLQLRRKYNRHCQNQHGGSQNPNNSSANLTNQSFLGRNNFNTLAHPFWPTMNIFGDSDTISFGYSSVKANQIATALPRFRRQQSCHIEFSFENGNSKYQSTKPNLDSLKSMDDKEVKITLALGNSMFAASPNSETTKLNAEMCKTLRENLPWQKEMIPSILQALMDPKGMDQDKWLLIQGDDFIGKRRLAVSIAKSMLGSSDLVFCMNMRENTRTLTQNCEMLHKALKDHEKMVVLVEDVDCADPEFVKFLDDGFESGDMGKLMKREGDSGRNIMVLTTNDSLSFNKKRDITDSVIQLKIVVSGSKMDSGVVSVLDHKRKSDWDSPIMIKSRRNSEIEDVISNELDLNVKVDEDEQGEDKAGDLSPVSSDLTREITTDQRNSPKFLGKINNRFVFNRSTDQQNQAKDMFSSMFKRSFHEACGGRNISSFNVDEMVLEEVFQGSGFYLNNLFEQWLNNVFQRSLHMVDTWERGNIRVRLCLGGEGEYCSNDGFMGTSLPNGIQVSFIV
ncbi:protein SMAX1-LIKE 4-like isoform X1 [Primulina eburnea]|uniref:protein SMAX1-LIKE 4-like isoform X1 n=1 Tax=Primulina eburnea TaxID=1245227 RepID=UPI003C6BF92D